MINSQQKITKKRISSLLVGVLFIVIIYALIMLQGGQGNEGFVPLYLIQSILILLLLRGIYLILREICSYFKNAVETNNKEIKMTYSQFIQIIKTHKKILVVFSLLFLGFYWYSYRPYEIKKNCAIQAAGNAGPSELDPDLYNACLHYSGL